MSITTTFPPISSSGGTGITGAEVPAYEINYVGVDTYADLPAANTQANEVYIVRQDSGTWLLGNKKKAGLYYSNGVSWSYTGNSVSIDDTLTSNESVWSSSKVSSAIAESTSLASLLTEYTVTGSAVTSIDFSGLDINTHKSYRIEIDLKSNTSSAFNVSLFINNDTTATNYYSQLGQENGTVSAAARSNNAYIAFAQNSYVSLSDITLRLISLTPTANSLNTYGTSASAVTTGRYSVVKTATVSNITQLTFVASIASAIGIGSKIRIYRGDV